MQTDRKIILETIKNRLSVYTISHSYSCYKKLNALRNNDPFNGSRGEELAKQLYRIIFENLKDLKVIYSYSYGLGGIKNIVFSVPYKSFQLILGIDIGNLILLNMFDETEEINVDDKLKIILGANNFFYIEYYGETFTVGNTYLAFEKLNDEFSFSKNKGFNKIFKKEFSDYVNNSGVTNGSYEYVQFGEYVIITNYNPTVERNYYTSKLWVGEEI